MADELDPCHLLKSKSKNVSVPKWQYLHPVHGPKWQFHENLSQSIRNEETVNNLIVNRKNRKPCPSLTLSPLVCLGRSWRERNIQWHSWRYNEGQQCVFSGSTLLELICNPDQNCSQICCIKATGGRAMWSMVTEKIFILYWFGKWSRSHDKMQVWSRSHNVHGWAVWGRQTDVIVCKSNWSCVVTSEEFREVGNDDVKCCKVAMDFGAVITEVHQTRGREGEPGLCKGAKISGIPLGMGHLITVAEQRGLSLWVRHGWEHSQVRWDHESILAKWKGRPWTEENYLNCE